MADVVGEKINKQKREKDGTLTIIKKIKTKKIYPRISRRSGKCKFITYNYDYTHSYTYIHMYICINVYTKIDKKIYNTYVKENL